MGAETRPRRRSAIVCVLSFLDEYFEQIFCGIGMFASFMLVFFQVVIRAGIAISGGGAIPTWIEELARYLFIFFSYLAIPIALKKGSMVRVDILADHLPPKLQRIFQASVDFVCLVMAGIFCREGIGLVQQMLVFPTATPGLGIPYWLIYSVIPLGFALTCIRVIQDLVSHWKDCKVSDYLIGAVVAVVIHIPIFVGLELPIPLWMFGYFFIYLILGMPIAFSLAMSAIITIITTGILPLNYVPNVSITAIDSVPLMAIPFFVAAGNFMGNGGLSKRLMNVCDGLLGGFHGGLALATILTCMLFAAMSGSGPATVAAIGSITIPTMVERGYDKRFAAAVVACAGAIGVLIPPSNPFVVYAISAKQSITTIFMAGIIPGIAVGVGLMVVTVVSARKHHWKNQDFKFSLHKFLKECWDAKWALFVPVLILGGIYSGLFTPTESAAVAAVYGAVVGLFIYREMNFKQFLLTLMDSCVTSTIVIGLMGLAGIFCNIMTVAQIPVIVANFIVSLTESKILILLLINVLLLIVGTFMEAAAAITVLTPILLPVVTAVGVDPIHFGVIMVLNLAIGFVTPPVGVNLFVASSMTRQSIKELMPKVIPLLISMIVVLLLVTYIEGISLSLPGLLGEYVPVH